MIAIGVTGHRYLVEFPKISAAIDRAINEIEAAFGECSFRVISTLAEGADRLVVHRLLARKKAELFVPLPLQKEEYLKDFKTAASRSEFLELLDQAEEWLTLPEAKTREQAYAFAGRYVLDHCDVLIAIWDGREAQGEGGTGEIVDEARRRGLPVVWIFAGNRRPGKEEPATSGQKQGAIIFERFPSTSQ
jgi:hypothetical protein